MNYCNKCEHFKHESKRIAVGKDYQGTTHPATSDFGSDDRVFHKLLCYCTKVNRLIKNLGTELMEKEFKAVEERAKKIKEADGNYIPVLNELFDDYMNRLKLEIPEWCSLQKV